MKYFIRNFWRFDDLRSFILIKKKSTNYITFTIAYHILKLFVQLCYVYEKLNKDVTK